MKALYIALFVSHSMIAMNDRDGTETSAPIPMLPLDNIKLSPREHLQSSPTDRELTLQEQLRLNEANRYQKELEEHPEPQTPEDQERLDQLKKIAAVAQSKTK